MKEIRPLRADEIDVRVQSIKDNGYTVLLYKDARCDMKILDETFGTMNWQRHHEVVNNNLFCTVSIYDENKNQWIDKQDVGVPSNAQGEKGESSDSFKRACINIGIGRELYTAPFIWINPLSGEIRTRDNKKYVNTKLKVRDIEYNDNREIIRLEIRDDKGNIRYQYQAREQMQNKGNGASASNNESLEKEKIKSDIVAMCKVKNIDLNKVTEELRANYGTDKILDLNLNQMKMLKDKVSRW